MQGGGAWRVAGKRNERGVGWCARSPGVAPRRLQSFPGGWGWSPLGCCSAPLLAGRGQESFRLPGTWLGWAVSRINDSAWLGPVKQVRPDPELHSVSLCFRECFFLFVFMKVVKSFPPLWAIRQWAGQGWHVGSAGLPWGSKWLWKCSSVPATAAVSPGLRKSCWPCLPPAGMA